MPSATIEERRMEAVTTFKTIHVEHTFSSGERRDPRLQEKGAQAFKIKWF